MMSAPYYDDLSQRIAGFFGQGRCFLLAKGRVGLYAGLKAMDLPRGAKVLMPGYTCMVVPSAVQFAGLEPVYADIDPATYNIDPRCLDEAAGSGVAALIVQHTYGIPCDMTSLVPWAATRNIPLIEDCCHVFGSRHQGRLCGTFGRFAFMSGQWNKPFSTGLGGILLVNDEPLADQVARSLNEEAARPGWARNALLWAQLQMYQLLVRPKSAMRITAIYSALYRMGLVIGSSSRPELRGEMPKHYLATMAPCQVRQGLREMARIDENIQHRSRLAAFYDEALPREGFASLPRAGDGPLPLLRYPVRVANKGEVLKLAAQRGLEIGSWFEIPLHPAGTCMETFAYCPGMCPQAEMASRQVVNLPTHRKVTLAVAEQTIEFLRDYARPVT